MFWFLFLVPLSEMHFVSRHIIDINLTTEQYKLKLIQVLTLMFQVKFEDFDFFHR